MTSKSNLRTLSVLVEDIPGVLARVSALFFRRGFNIESLAVGSTENPSISRITIVADITESQLEQLVKQLNKLINVLKILELPTETSVNRRIVLVKVRADQSTRSDVIESVNLFRAKVVDVTPESVVIEATGDDQKINAMLKILEPFGIRELVQSGIIATGRGNKILSVR